MLIPRVNLFKKVWKLQSFRCLSTKAQEVDSVGPIVFQKLGGEDKGIAIYGINSPENKNALSFDLIKCMKEINQIIKEDMKISVVILHSLVPGIFCAGRY